HPHERGVAPAVAVEHLFARKRGFYGSPRDHSQLRDYDLMTEGIALPAEAAPVRARDHADARRRELQHFGERPVHVVRRLGSAPQRELPISGPVGYRRVLLHRQVGASLEEEQVLAYDVGLRQRRLDVAEFEIDQLVDVPGVGIVVDRRLRVLDRVERIRGRTRASANRVTPVTFAVASTVRWAFPTTRRPEGFLPDAIQGLRRRLRVLSPHASRRQLDGFVDLDVTGAAAEVARERLLD